MKNRTVFITVFHSFISKNFLNTEAFVQLLDIPNTKYILLVPNQKKDFFSEVYKFDNVEIVGLELSNFSKLKIVKFFSILSHLLLSSHYLWYKKIERRDNSKSLLKYPKYYFEILFTYLFKNSKMAKNILKYFFLIFVRTRQISDLFKKYKPDLLFSTDVFDESDLLFSAEARRHKTKILGMIRSWDNCYSKGILRVIPDILFVNNLVLKEEASTIHNVPIENIRICGLPQYDHFINDTRTKKEDFYSNIGADISKKLILFAPAGKILSDTDNDICDILKKAILDKSINKPAQILIRNHPHHPAILDSYIGDTDLIIDNPGKRFGKNPKEAELTNLDSIHLGDSLYYSDIIIYTATTLGIDSLIFDKPQIIIDFDGYRSKKYTDSIKRYHNEDHMKKLIKCGGVWIVHNREELLEAINAYLLDPTIMKKGREDMIKQQIYFLDGKSGERLASFIKQEILSI